MGVCASSPSLLGPLFLKLLAKNPKRARQFSGEVFRAYTRLAGGDRWESRPDDSLGV